MSSAKQRLKFAVKIAISLSLHLPNAMTKQQYPAIWRRFAAIIYDTLLVTAISMGYGAICVGISLALYNDSTVLTSTIAFQIGWVVVWFSFFCFFWTRAGQTLGMRTWRLVIVKQETLEQPSILQCISRLILAPLGLGLFCLGLIREDKQCLHDLLSHTQIIQVGKNH